MQPEEVVLQTDLKRLAPLTEALHEMAGDMVALQQTFKSRERGFYTSDEHDAIENLLFRYVMCRDTMWEVVDFHRDYETRFTSEEHQTKSFAIGFVAALSLCEYGSLFVHAFLDSPQTIAKLNEAYYRLEIPEDTYDRVFMSLTNPDNIRDLRAAVQIYSQEMAKANTPLHRLAQTDPAYGKLLNGLQKKCVEVDARIEDILEKRSLLSSALRNQLRHSKINQLAQAALKKTNSAMEAIRALTYTRMSRIKEPAAGPLDFTAAQCVQLKKVLRPGDVILTYSAGYMCNLFLPGTFKHGITYVGSPEERKQAGLEQWVEDKQPAQREKMQRDLETASLPDGSEADLIEAVAEGVVFNSLQYILKAKANRLAVWRPRLTHAQRINSLGTVFSFLGCGYDFKFDFNDASEQCCTELIYRSLNKVGPIELPLTRRLGRQTLSADDFCQNALRQGTAVFELVALAVADESPSTNRNLTAIYTGQKALDKMLDLVRETR